MHLPWSRLALIATLLIGAASCGSVGSKSSDASGLGGASGTGGANGAGGSTVPGTGGKPGVDAGQAGSGGSSDGGVGGSPNDAGIIVRGGLGPLGPSPVPAGTLRVVRARLQPSPSCSASICVSGGLVP